MTSSTERDILNYHVERLIAEGYDVYVEPAPSLIPAIARGYRPDVIAIKDDRKIALEIATRSSTTEKKLGEIAARFNTDPLWEFRIIWAEPASGASRLPVQTKATIQRTIAEIEKLRDEQLYRASLLLGWAAFEAAARAIAEPEFGRPQTPGRLVQILGQDGYLTPDEVDGIRALIDKRNRLVHGALDTDVSRNDVDRLLDALGAIVSEISG